MPLVLMIDDDKPNADLMKATLETFHIDVMIAYTGKDGYDIAYIHEPDLIFTDLRMPSETWTGYKTAQQLKSNPATANIPVVALTAAGDADQAIEAGCNAILRRPYDQQDLLRILDNYLPLPL